jgi:hypothetical protein
MMLDTVVFGAFNRENLIIAGDLDAARREGF